MRFWGLLILIFLVVPAQASQTVGATWYGNELRGNRTASGSWVTAGDGCCGSRRRGIRQPSGWLSRSPRRFLGPRRQPT